MRTLRPIKLNQTEPLISTGGHTQTETYCFLEAHYHRKRSREITMCTFLVAQIQSDVKKVKKVVCSKIAGVHSLKRKLESAKIMGARTL